MVMPDKLSGQKKDKKSLKRGDVLEGATVYRFMMENSFIPLCIFGSQGEIFDFSSAVTVMLKCSREELLGKKISDYLDLEEKREFFIKAKKQLLHEGIYAGGIGLKTFDGQIKQVEYTASSLREDLYLACFRDNSAYWESERFKDKFIYIVSHVSHELRRPLATISACLDLLHTSFHEKLKNMKRFNLEGIKLEQVLSFNQDFQRLNTAAKSVEQMVALINSILDLTRLGLGKIILNKQKFMLEDLLRAVAEETQLTSSDKSIVLLGAEKGALAVEADPVRIREVVENLVSNAVKYSPPGGEIIIAVEKKEANALIFIRDQGLGIAPEEQPQVFERFYMAPQAKQMGLGGLGLGLHISKQLVELHQGQIWLESKEGEGSTFYFTLPLLLPDKN